MLKDRSFRLSVILTLLFFGVGLAFLLFGLAELSGVLFLLLPIVLGLSIGALPHRRWAIWGAVAATLFFLFFLLIGELSGFICVIMAIPVILPFLFLGSVIVHLARRYRKIKPTTRINILLLPLMPFLLAAPIEHYVKNGHKEEIEVRSAQVYDYTPMQVYEAIKSVDTLVAEKPLLMHFDLPVPVKCVLEKEEVGGLRVCHFNGGNMSRGDFGGGTITEKITRLEKGKVLEMDVTGCTIIGRKWLGFTRANYYFEPHGPHGCKLVRVTVYTSSLSPRVYWQPMEEEGIRQEHTYVFRNLQKDLERMYGRTINPVN